MKNEKRSKKQVKIYRNKRNIFTKDAQFSR